MASMRERRDLTMKKDRPSPQRIRLFRDDRLEALTMVTPRAFAVTWVAVLAFALYESWGTAGIVASAALVLLGLVIWTLFEYAMHRFLFHMKLQSDFGQWIVFLTHGNHHAAPVDRYRNLMPPLVSIGILGTVWCVFLLLIGPAGSALFLGFAIGYVVYDVVHFACHQFPMRGPLLGRLRRHHIRHHFGKREGNYAITAIFWDRVFRTSIPAKRG